MRSSIRAGLHVLVPGARMGQKTRPDRTLGAEPFQKHASTLASPQVAAPHRCSEARALPMSPSEPASWAKPTARNVLYTVAPCRERQRSAPPPWQLSDHQATLLQTEHLNSGVPLTLSMAPMVRRPASTSDPPTARTARLLTLIAIRPPPGAHTASYHRRHSTWQQVLTGVCDLMLSNCICLYVYKFASACTSDDRHEGCAMTASAARSRSAPSVSPCRKAVRCASRYVASRRPRKRPASASSCANTCTVRTCRPNLSLVMMRPTAVQQVTIKGRTGLSLRGGVMVCCAGCLQAHDVALEACMPV